MALPTVVLTGVAAALVLWMLPARAWEIRPDALIVFGLLGMWRYSWMMLHIARAWIYEMVTFPKIRKAADELDPQAAYPGHLYFMIPTYKETPWISQHMIHGLLREVADLPSRVTLVIPCAGGAEDDLFLRVLDQHPLRRRVDVILMKQSQGKRIGMGHALRGLARKFSEDDEDSLIVFMDGDSVMGPGALTKTLPLFKLYPKLGALTSDELSIVEGSRWYRKWYELRFSQRHRLMRSLALSRRVLTLTGRFSVFRTRLAVTEEFIEYLEKDELDHWLYGRFRFLTGDDKSTWYYLLERGWEMLYVPDALVFCMESSGDQPIRQSMAKMYRWFGNMLRNNGRAIRLGPKPMGFFIWWCLVDQRLSMWTSLVGPIGAIFLALFSSPYYLVFYLFGATCARMLYLVLLALEGHRMSMIHLPQLFYTQWMGAIVKIWVLFRLDRQTWGKARGGQSTDGGTSWPRRLMPGFQTTMSGLIFLVAVALAVGVLELPPMPRLAWAATMGEQVFSPEAPALGARVIHASDYGVRGDDEDSDSEALREALAALPAGGLAELRLPAGRIVLDEPLVIDRSHTRVVGAGRTRTRLVGRFPSSVGDAVIAVRGPGRDRSTRARVADRLLAGDSVVELAPGEKSPTTRHLWVGAPNTEDFMGNLGSQKWNRPYPWLRQSIVAADSGADRYVLLGQPLEMEYPESAVVEPVELVEGVSLSALTVTVEVPGHDPASAHARYENLHPAFLVDGISFTWAGYGVVSDVDIVMAGRHPLNFESSIEISATDVVVDGAWNKGDGGTGYVRFARSTACHLERAEVRNVRHVVFQWSAARNLVTDSVLETDVNFHGGFSRDNVVRRTRIEPPPSHPWRQVTRTPADAHWAPPDGPGNHVLLD